MTQAPATGLWGPGDFGPDFVTIDDLLRKVIHLNRTTPKNEWHTEHFQMGERAAVRNAILDLAHDLDARGLVLVEHGDLDERADIAWHEGYAEGTRQGKAAYTADADLVTGGE